MSQDPKKAGSEASKATSRNRRRGKRRKAPGQFGKGAYVENSATRHQARILAMQTLFEVDTTDHELDEVIGRIHSNDVELPDSVKAEIDEDETSVDEVPGDVARHAEMLARGTTGALDEINPIIEKAAPQFPITQIAAVDRNVLRLAIFELYHQPEVPVAVAINEAVEIAKRFGGENSSRFVNGVLGTISRQLPAGRQSR